MRVEYNDTGVTTWYPQEKQSFRNYEGNRYISVGESTEKSSLGRLATKVASVAAVIVFGILIAGLPFLNEGFRNLIKKELIEIWSGEERVIHFVPYIEKPNYPLPEKLNELNKRIEAKRVKNAEKFQEMQNQRTQQLNEKLSQLKEKIDSCEDSELRKKYEKAYHNMKSTIESVSASEKAIAISLGVITK